MPKIANEAPGRGISRTILLVGAVAAAAAYSVLFGIGCATTGGSYGRTEPSSGISAFRVIAGLEPGHYSGLAASLDGRIFLKESSGWRLQAYDPAGKRLFEVSLPSGRCLTAGGQIQGFFIADLTSAAFIRYDQNGEQAFKATLSGQAIDAFYIAASGEAVVLDAGQELVVFHDQGFRETRRWKLKGRGRPQSLAADMLGGLVAVAYPGEARLDLYSMFGVMLESLPYKLGPGPQALAFDGQGRLWAASAGGRAVALKRQGRRWEESASCEIPGLRALGPGLGGSVMALGDSAVYKLGTE